MAAGQNRVAGKIALVTGAASGIGRAIAHALAEQGATVLVADIDENTALAVVAEIVDAGGSAEAVPLDVTNEDQWVEAIDEALERHQRLDILVNNAGIGGGDGSIEDMTVVGWRRIQAVNSEGVMLGCKHGVRAMKQSGGGSIVNMSSIAGIVGAPQLAAYCASKGAVRMLTKSVALHCARKGYGIRCNSVHPSYTDTPMVDRMVAAHRDPERMRAALQSASPLGRMGEPADVAGAVLYLASDDAAFVTGTELVVDGGVTAT
ncbi:glucose 1-dehydrogenase [Thalassobaculum sp.]|uniref:SDR family NAD(P)-dependent oxidoreductase n=1 Tax=Thalassobaculum sp. TaxID=2022740 RepID=UPI0032ED127B